MDTVCHAWPLTPLPGRLLLRALPLDALLACMGSDTRFGDPPPPVPLRFLILTLSSPSAGVPFVLAPLSGCLPASWTPPRPMWALTASRPQGLPLPILPDGSGLNYQGRKAKVFALKKKNLCVLTEVKFNS